MLFSPENKICDFYTSRMKKYQFNHKNLSRGDELVADSYFLKILKSHKTVIKEGRKNV